MDHLHEIRLFALIHDPKSVAVQDRNRFPVGLTVDKHEFFQRPEATDGPPTFEMYFRTFGASVLEVIDYWDFYEDIDQDALWTCV